ncbi:MAG: PQQ-binding-like beta-propeller repeat protein [Planctomycetales bacterium]|nr:PQQ-binding-like beta-propeller repeat protein [Planctomycetales bacterium]
MSSIYQRLISLLLIVFPGTAISEDWYRWRGPHLDGISTETRLNCDWKNDQAKLAWKAQVGTGFSSVVVKDKRAFTLGHVDDQDVVYCLDVDDGNQQWKFGYPAELGDRDFEGGPTSTPTIDDDRVYVLARAGELFCFDAASGKVNWRKQVADEASVRLPGWGFSAAPLVVGEMLLLNMGESGVAIDKRTGELIWSSADRECGYATPVVVGEGASAVAIFASGKAYTGVEAKSGKQLWSERWLTSFNCNAADPIVHDGKMFLSSGYNRGAALFDMTGETPSLIWKSKEMKNQIHGCLLYKEHLYGIDGDMESGARLRCMEWSTGEVVWSVDDLHPGGLAIAGGRLILLTEPGELVVAPASPQGWTPTSRATVTGRKSWTAPVISGGRIFCRSIDGLVVCVDCRE